MSTVPMTAICWLRVLLFLTSTAIFFDLFFDSLCLGGDIPYLIARQPTSVQAAWQSIDELIQQNESLEQPLPDPLFARAELWAAAGNHEDALEDYLKATKLLFASRPNLIEQSRALNRLSGALDRLSKHPRTEFPYEADEAFWLGVNAFSQNRLEAAADFFAEATRLDPSDSVYRAYRGVTLKRLGKMSDADRQLAVAQSILHRPNCPPKELREFHRRLEKLQGAERLWIDRSVNAPHSASRQAKQEAEEWLKTHQAFLR